MQAGANVVLLQIRKVGKDGGFAHALREHLENVCHANSHAADARTAAALPGVKGYAFVESHVGALNG